MCLVVIARRVRVHVWSRSDVHIVNCIISGQSHRRKQTSPPPKQRTSKSAVLPPCQNVVLQFTAEFVICLDAISPFCGVSMLCRKDATPKSGGDKTKAKITPRSAAYKETGGGRSVMTSLVTHTIHVHVHTVQPTVDANAVL